MSTVTRPLSTDCVRCVVLSTLSFNPYNNPHEVGATIAPILRMGTLRPQVPELVTCRAEIHPLGRLALAVVIQGRRKYAKYALRNRQRWSQNHSTARDKNMEKK